MDAVCSGDHNCQYYDREMCIVTPLSQDCSSPMQEFQKSKFPFHKQSILGRLALKDVLCNKQDVKYCDPMEGLFNYMKDWLGECGIVDGEWCAHGNDFVAGSSPADTYYGYCAQSLQLTSTTTDSSTTVTTNGDIVQLYADSSFEYYKVRVSNGITLVEGSVAETCKAVGMQAVCSGVSGCKYVDTSMCLMTSLSQDCSSPM